MQQHADAGQEGRRPVVYLFTTFPVASETFLRREVAAMRGLGIDVRAWSLWGGDAEVDGLAVGRIGWRGALAQAWRLPWAAVRRPDVFAGLTAEWLSRPVPSALNLLENLWGAACGILLEGQVRHLRPGRIHAVWASMPATAAWVLHRLTGIPWTLGAHAYDVFEHGGDWILSAKLRSAALVHTTTQAAQRRLDALGCPPGRIALIRRGLGSFPPLKPLRADRRCLRIVSIGRLVEKKGLFDLLAVARALRRAGVDYSLRIVGEGPLGEALQARIAADGLSGHVALTGLLDPAGVARALEWADVLAFTGRVARSGDRDGFPNVVGEAMAAGVVVVSTPVEGVSEVIHDGESGFLRPMDPQKSRPLAGWVSLLDGLRTDDAACERIRQAARRWAEAEFDATANARALTAAVDARVSG